MRKLGAFYFVLMVLLSILPCNDELEEHSTTINTIVSITDQEDDSATESCSPLCLCACCGQKVITTAQIDLEVPFLIAKAHKIGTIHNFAPKKRALGIWQPPKLV